MDLQEFVKTQHKLLDRFEAFWEREHRKDPENFPATMDPGDWDEQIISYLQNPNHRRTS